MFYVIVSLLIVILICTKQIFSKTYYPQTFIYNEDSFSAIKRLANNLINVDNSANIPNVYIIKKTLDKYYRICKKSKRKENYFPIDVNYYNFYKEIAKCFYKYDFFVLSKVAHYDRKIKLYEISNVLLSYNSYLDKNILFKHLKVFADVNKYLFEELIYAKEAVILSIFEKLSKVVQELILTKDFKNKPNFEDEEFVKKLAQYSVSIKNLLKSIQNIEKIEIKDFLIYSDNYDFCKNLEDKNLTWILLKISKLSKSTNESEEQIIDRIIKIKEKYNSNAVDAVKKYYLNIKYKKLNLSSYKIVLFLQTLVIIVFGAIIAFIPVVFQFNYTLLQLWVLFLSSISLSYYIIKNFEDDKYYFDKYQIIFQIVSFLGLVNIVATKNLEMALCHLVLFLALFVLLLGKRIKKCKNKLLKSICSKKNWMIKQNNLEIKLTWMDFPNVKIFKGKNLVYVIDSYGRNYIQYEQKNYNGNFINPFNKNGNFFIYNDKSLSFCPSYEKELKNEFKIKHNCVFLRSNFASLKIELLKNIDAICYELFTQIRNIKYKLNFFEMLVLEKNENYVIIKVKNIYVGILIKHGSIKDFCNCIIDFVLYSNKIEILEIYENNINNLKNKIDYLTKFNSIKVQKTFNELYRDDLAKLVQNQNDLKILTKISTMVNYPIFEEIKFNFVLNRFEINCNREEENLKIAQIFNVLNELGQNNEIFIFYDDNEKIEKYKKIKNLKMIKINKILTKNEQHKKYKIMTDINMDKIVKDIKAENYIDPFKNVSIDLIKTDNEESDLHEKELKNSNNKNLLDKSLCLKKGGLIIGGDAYLYNAKNSLISSNFDLFVFYKGKKYIFGGSIIKNGLICNSSIIKKQVDIEIGNIIVENGAILNGVCFYYKFSFKNKLNFTNLIVYLDKEISKFGCNIFSYSCTKLNNNFFKIELFDQNETIYFKTNFDFDLITNKYLFQSFSDKEFSYNNYRQNRLFYPSVTLSFVVKNCLKTEQEYFVVYSNDFDKIINFNFNYFKNNAIFEKILDDICIEVFSNNSNEQFCFWFNHSAQLYILKYLFSHINKNLIHGTKLFIDCKCLKSIIHVCPDYVYEKILYFASHMFIDGDFLSDFIDLNGSREKCIEDVINFFDLVNNYIFFTQNYEILYEKMPYLYLDKYNQVTFTKYSETLIQHIVKAFNFIKDRLSILNMLNLLTVLKDLSIYIDSEYLTYFNTIKIDLISKLNSININDLTDQESIYYLEYIFPAKSSELFKKIDISKLNNLYKIKYYEILSLYENKNIYEYINDIHIEEFDSIEQDAYFYSTILSKGFGIKFSNYYVQKTNTIYSKSLNNLSINYKGKQIQIKIEKDNSKVSYVLIDKYKYLNIRKVRFSQAKRDIVFFN